MKTFHWFLAGALLLAACSGEDGPANGGTTGDVGLLSSTGVGGGLNSSLGDTTSIDAAVFGETAVSGGTTGGATVATTGAVTGGSTLASFDGGSEAGATTSNGGSGANGGASGTNADGPKDGDPNAPVVEVPGVPCREASDLTDLSSYIGNALNATIDGRELAIDYPCGKHEGAHMTVILNLHGTLIGGAPFLYQRNYFSAYKLVDSHNLIVVHPQSVSRAASGAQWGNMDGGADLPHLNAVMSWVYENFSKFNIRSTWVGGHSWGALYAAGGFRSAGYVCNEMFADKFKGVIGMSRLSVPSCADRLSMIATRGETEGIALVDQDSVAAAHGCDLPMKGPDMVGNNEWFHYDGCDPGWVHEDYNMLGKGHVDAMDAEVVLKIVEAIKSTEI